MYTYTNLEQAINFPSQNCYLFQETKIIGFWNKLHRTFNRPFPPPLCMCELKNIAPTVLTCIPSTGCEPSKRTGFQYSLDYMCIQNPLLKKTVRNVKGRRKINKTTCKQVSLDLALWLGYHLTERSNCCEPLFSINWY